MLFAERITDEILFYVKEKLLTESPDIFQNTKDVEEAVEALAELMLIEDELILFNDDTKNSLKRNFFPENAWKSLIRRRFLEQRSC